MDFTAFAALAVCFTCVMMQPGSLAGPKWAGARDRDFLPALAAGICFIGVGCYLLYAMGSGNALWFLLIIISLLPLTPISIAWVTDDYKRTLPELMQRVADFNPRDDRMFKMLFGMGMVLIISGGARAGWEIGGGSISGARFGGGFMAVFLGTLAITVIYGFLAQVVVVYASTVQTGQQTGQQNGGGASTTQQSGRQQGNRSVPTAPLNGPGGGSIVSSGVPSSSVIRGRPENASASVLRGRPENASSSVPRSESRGEIKRQGVEESPRLNRFVTPPPINTRMIPTTRENQTGRFVRTTLTRDEFLPPTRSGVEIHEADDFNVHSENDDDDDDLQRAPYQRPLRLEHEIDRFNS